MKKTKENIPAYCLTKKQAFIRSFKRSIKEIAIAIITLASFAAFIFMTLMLIFSL